VSINILLSLMMMVKLTGEIGGNDQPAPKESKKTSIGRRGRKSGKRNWGIVFDNGLFGSRDHSCTAKMHCLTLSIVSLFSSGETPLGLVTHIA